MAKNNLGRTVRTTLDSLPYGELSSEEIRGRVKREEIPQGITKSMLTRDIVTIAWPSLVELVLTQLTSMADQIMVGRLPGAEGVMAISAVGLAAQPKLMLMTMIQALNVGATALVARFRGQQDRAKANQVFKQALLLSFALSVIFMIAGITWSEPLVRFISGEGGISEETIGYSVQYLNIQMYGFVPLCLGVTVTAALRGIGDTKLPLIYNTIANVVNLFFNYVMIYGKLGCPAMGVAGASWATIIGQSVAFVIAMSIVLRPKHYIFLNLKEKFKYDPELMKGVINIGIPSMIEQLFMRAGVIIYGRAVASLGDLSYATHQVCMSVQSMSFMMGQAFANAATTLMGQSLGKRRYDMAAIYMRQTRNLGIIVSIVMATLFVIFRRTIMSWFNDTAEVIAMGSQILILIAASQPIQTDQFITSGGLRGAGDTRYTAVVIAITVLGVRSSLGMLTIKVFHWGLWGAWIALIADQLLRTVLMIWRYNSGKWKILATERFAKLDS